MWRASRPDTRGILDTPGVQEALPRYVEVIRGKKYPKYMIADSYRGGFSRADSPERLWELHDVMLDTFKETQESTTKKPKKVTKSLFRNLILIFL